MRECFPCHVDIYWMNTSQRRKTGQWLKYEREKPNFRIKVRTWWKSWWSQFTNIQSIESFDWTLNVEIGSEAPNKRGAVMIWQDNCDGRRRRRTKNCIRARFFEVMTSRGPQPTCSSEWDSWRWWRAHAQRDLLIRWWFWSPSHFLHVLLLTIRDFPTISIDPMGSPRYPPAYKSFLPPQTKPRDMLVA